MNTKVNPTIISATTNLGIINDVNRIVFCSGMFSYAAANATSLCSDILKAFNAYKAHENDAPIGGQAFSTADEIKKFKDLLDTGVIWQKEFDARKDNC